MSASSNLRGTTTKSLKLKSWTNSEGFFFLPSSRSNATLLLLCSLKIIFELPTEGLDSLLLHVYTCRAWAGCAVANPTLLDAWAWSRWTREKGSICVGLQHKALGTCVLESSEMDWLRDSNSQKTPSSPLPLRSPPALLQMESNSPAPWCWALAAPLSDSLKQRRISGYSRALRLRDFPGRVV